MLYAPKRCTLEVWAPRAGVQLCHRRVSEQPGLLLAVPDACGGWRGAALPQWRSLVPRTAFFLDPAQGLLTDICSYL